MDDYAIIAKTPGGPDVMKVAPHAAGTPGPGEALVRHTAVGLNFLDVYHRSGQYPWPKGDGIIPGSEAAGVVEAVAPDVTHVTPGDRVAYTYPMGAYVSARVLAADHLLKLPVGVSDETAAGVTLKGLTAHYLIHDTFAVHQGMTVLVQAAAGGVGLLMGQWLKAKGVRAIGTAGGPDKVALAQAHGYDAVIDYCSQDFAARVRDLTDGAGVDAVYDSVGQDTWRGSLACLRPHGTLVVFGQSSGAITDLSLGDLAAGSFHLCRPVLFHYIATPQALQARGAALFAALHDGTLTSEVRNRFDLKDAARAHCALETRQTTGTTVLIP